MDTFVPAIIDVEASGFGKHSYPIEIGVAFSDGEKFCGLIKPEPDWIYWDSKAEAVHQISREILGSNGVSAREMAEKLNTHLQGKTVYSDCWTVDKPWLDLLFHAANLRAEFRVRAIEMILDETQIDNWKNTHSYNIENSQMSRHRASADAELIQKTWIDTKFGSTAKRQANF